MGNAHNPKHAPQAPQMATCSEPGESPEALDGRDPRDPVQARVQHATSRSAQLHRSLKKWPIQNGHPESNLLLGVSDSVNHPRTRVLFPRCFFFFFPTFSECPRSGGPQSMNGVCIFCSISLPRGSLPGVGLPILIHTQVMTSAPDTRRFFDGVFSAKRTGPWV